VGALVEAGISRDDAEVYAESVRQGNVLLTVQAEGSQAALAREIMASSNAVKVEDRRRTWASQGWTGFDSDSIPWVPPTQPH
jgi:hypothetical protein